MVSTPQHLGRPADVVGQYSTTKTSTADLFGTDNAIPNCNVIHPDDLLPAGILPTLHINGAITTTCTGFIPSG